MSKFIEKSIIHVNRLFPEIYATRTARGSYHWAFAWDRNRLVAVGLNKPDKPSPKALRFGRMFGLKTKQEWPFEHAEENLIGKLIGLGKVDSSLNIVVLRLNKFGVLQNSLPCSNCQIVLNAYGFDKIWYSTKEGKIERYTGRFA